MTCHESVLRTHLLKLIGPARNLACVRKEPRYQLSFGLISNLEDALEASKLQIEKKSAAYQAS